MKQFWILFLCLGLVACPGSQQSGQNPGGSGKVDRSAALSDLTSVTAALQTFYLQNSKYPEKLSELGISLQNPDDLDYDSKKGTVRSKTYPDL